MSFEEVVQTHFPGSTAQEHFVRRAAVTLIQHHGFAPANTLACVGVCRDELCRSLSVDVEALWGEAFDLSSLAGSLTLGATGFAAARAHAPVVRGRCRFLFFVFSHIGIGADGELGVAIRPGHDEPSAACGALVALQQQWRSAGRSRQIDWQDPEQSLLRMRLCSSGASSAAPDLVELTKMAHRATLQDLQTMIGDWFDPARDDYAVVAGVQIHGPDQTNLIWPGATYVVVEGVRSEVWV